MIAQETSEKAQNNLKQIEQWTQTEPEGRYIKFTDGQIRVLSFSLEKIELSESTFYDSKTGAPRISKRANFTVVDLDSPFGEEKIWSVSKTWAKAIVDELKKGNNVLAVQRTGSGLKDTKYEFKQSR